MEGRTNTDQRVTSQAERDAAFWHEIRRALLMAAAAIERRYGPAERTTRP